jgi:hypothetical protein
MKQLPAHAPRRLVFYARIGHSYQPPVAWSVAACLRATALGGRWRDGLAGRMRPGDYEAAASQCEYAVPIFSRLCCARVAAPAAAPGVVIVSAGEDAVVTWAVAQQASRLHCTELAASHGIKILRPAHIHQTNTDASAHSAARCDIHGLTSQTACWGFHAGISLIAQTEADTSGKPVRHLRSASSFLHDHTTTPHTYPHNTRDPLTQHTLRTLPHLRTRYFLRHGRPRAALRPVHSRRRRRRTAGRPGPEWQPPHSSAPGGMSALFSRRYRTVAAIFAGAQCRRGAASAASCATALPRRGHAAPSSAPQGSAQRCNALPLQSQPLSHPQTVLLTRTRKSTAPSASCGTTSTRSLSEAPA